MKKKFSIFFAILLCVVVSQAQWSLTGNAGTNPSVNFIGTTDTQALAFRTNNNRAGLIDYKKYNTSLGYNALFFQAGEFNTAFGQQSLWFNRNGGQNTAVGAWALRDHEIGSSNVAVGYAAFVNNEIGHDNTVVGSVALANCTEGRFNSSFGSASMLNVDSGANLNTAIGYNADFNVKARYLNSTMIGAHSRVSASNQVRIGDNSVTSIGGIVDWTTLSDGRFKSNVQANVPGLSFIKQLKPVTYTLKISELNNYLNPNGATEREGNKVEMPQTNAADEKIVHTGFIAQEVAEAAEKAGYDFHGVDKPKNEKDLYGLRYAEFVTPLVQAVQELSNANDSLKAQLNNLQSQMKDLIQQVNYLKNGNTAMMNSGLPVLKQNSPNPFNSNTTISYFLPTTTKNAQLVVSSVNGQLLKTIPLSNNGEGQTIIRGGELSAGSYFYTLIADGKRVDTKQMILTK